MIDLVVCAPEHRDSMQSVLGWLGVDVCVSCQAPAHALRVSSSDWQSSQLDLLRLDDQVHEREAAGEGLCLRLSSTEDDPAGFFEQVLTRYQRLLRFAWPADPTVARVLERHRLLFDLTKPLVRADYDHALDTWRWTLRLDLGASPALQLAALFHDVERLFSEADRRVEHLAGNYRAFKHAHAHAGARLSAEILRECGLPPPLRDRVQRLIERHEAPGDDDELAALNDADALSFFSLNSWGFAEYFDDSHTAYKVAYTLARLRPAARRYLGRFRHHPRVLDSLTEQLHHPQSGVIALEKLNRGSSMDESSKRHA